MSIDHDVLLEGKKLKEAAATFRQQISERVATTQGGIPTFHNNYLAFFIDWMTDHFPEEDWETCWQRVHSEDSNWVRAEVRRLQLVLKAQDEGRFVGYDKRSQIGEMDREKFVFSAGPGDEIGGVEMSMSQGSITCMEWKGNPLFKTVHDFSLVSMLIWEVCPGTVIELGSGNRASAIWVADLAHIFGLDCAVYSLDLRRPAISHAGVTFIEGDCEFIGNSFPSSMLKALPHPWIIIEDAHVNVLGLLNHFSAFMQPGDYFYVEDSRNKKEAELETWVRSYSDEFKVDSKYTDFFWTQCYVCTEFNI